MEWSGNNRNVLNCATLGVFKVFARSFSSSNTNTRLTHLIRSEGATTQNDSADDEVKNCQFFLWHYYAGSLSYWEKVNVTRTFNPGAELFQELVFNIFMPG